MKKIALIHFAYTPNIGGVEILLRDHAYTLSSLGFNVKILTGFGEENNKNIQLIVMPEFESIMKFNPDLQKDILENGIIDTKFYALSNKLKKQLEINLIDVDIVIIHNVLSVYRNLALTHALNQYLKENPGKKYVCWIHDHMLINEEKIKANFKWSNPLVKDLLTNPIKGVTYVAISETLKNLLEKVMKFYQNQLVTIPNGLNRNNYLNLDPHTDEIIKKFELHKANPLILSPVNIVERKNIDYMLRIIGFLKSYYPDVLYLITGIPSRHRDTLAYFNKVKELIKKLQLEKNVLLLHETGISKISAIRDFYQIADVIFYFSKSENFGLPILEAALTKTPIFTSQLSVFEEIGKNYIEYIDYLSMPPDKAAEIVKNYIDNSNLIALNYRVRNNYSLETILKTKLLPIIES